MKLGILGGTFDPIHLGHLRTAEEIGQELELDRVYLIPSASPPHKTNKDITPFHHRLTMTRLAATGSSQLDVLDLEGKRPGLSYSIETLEELHHSFGPDSEIFFIIGMDAFLDIKTWKQYRKLFDHAHFVIIQRPGFQADVLGIFLRNLDENIKETPESGVFFMPSGKTVFSMETTLMDISSTDIRGRVKAGKSIRFLVTESTLAYIIEKGLYAEA